MQEHLQAEALLLLSKLQAEAPAPPHEGATVALHQLQIHHAALLQEVVVEDK